MGFGGLPWQFWPMLVGMAVAYMTLIEIVKVFFNRHEARRPESIARQKGLAQRRAGAVQK
jgi:hypothetical protein